MRKTKNIFIAIILILCLTSCSSSSKKQSIDLSYGITRADLEDFENVTNSSMAMNVASLAMPATVEITCTITFSYLQTSFSPWGGGTSSETTKSSTSSATGFFINEEGYLLTNAHVITLSDYESYPNFKYLDWDISLNYAESNVKFAASIVEYDSQLDLAVLKTDEEIENLSFLPFYNITSSTSDKYGTDEAVKLLYGEPVVAVGNANGYGISITQGVVSAPLRFFVENDYVIEAIQTDAAINPGNSGGPLCNAFGTVVGINSFKIVTGNSENLGYAIPANVIINYLDSLTEKIQYYYTNARSFDSSTILASL